MVSIVDRFRANFPNWYSTEPPFNGTHRYSRGGKIPLNIFGKYWVKQMCVCVCDFVDFVF